MSLKTTIVVLILAVVGVCAMVWVQCGSTSAASGAGAAGVSRLFDAPQFPVEDIDRITLTRRGEPKMVFARTGSTWNQVEPFAYPMDPFSIRQIAVLAREVDVIQKLDPSDLRKDQSLATLDLDPPAAVVEYSWSASSAGSKTIELGRRAMAGRAYLRIKGDPAIHVVNAGLHDRALEMDPKEWRDRTIFHDAGVDSSRIEWHQSSADTIAGQVGGVGGRMIIARDRKTWKMLEPVQTRVDAMARDALFNALGGAKVAGFVLDQPNHEQLAQFGLAHPLASLIVTTVPYGKSADAQTIQQLFVGSKVGGGSQDFYGMIEGRPVVVRLSSASLAALFRQPQNLIEPTGSGIQPADVKMIVIRSGSNELKLERDMDKWRATDQGGHNNTEVPAPRVQELLDQLTTVRAPTVELRDYPRESEVATVTFHGYDQRAIDTIRIAHDEKADRWILENGDNVLRVFQAGLKLRLTAADFGL